MKKILFVVGCCLLLASCTTRFHTGADYKTVTVVYGLLSVNDSAHYIKITKGFYDENTDNRVIALNPDSLYFPNLDVTLQRLENGNPVENFPMQRVDLTLEGYPKLTGVFASQPNYAYKVKQMLNPDKTYRLRIVNNDNGKVIEGETPLVSTATKNFQFVKPFNELESMEFSDENNPYLFRWKGPATATFYDVLIRFRYQEVDMNTNDTTYITKDFPVARNVLYNSGEINTKITNIDFFKQLNSALGAAPDYIKRYVDTPGVMIMGGGSALKTYMDVNSVQGGITFDQMKPNYTNLTGEDVYGILSTRGYVQIPQIRFSANTVNAIISGPYTQSLHIVGISGK